MLHGGLKSGGFGSRPNPLPVIVKEISAPFPVIEACRGPEAGPLGAVLSLNPVTHC
jgi:hypothetical protein